MVKPLDAYIPCPEGLMWFGCNLSSGLLKSFYGVSDVHPRVRATHKTVGRKKLQLGITKNQKVEPRSAFFPFVSHFKHLFLI